MKKIRSAVAASALAITCAMPQAAMAMDPFIGQIQFFGFQFTPRGWAPCDGQLVAISSNSALFSLLGTTYGGDGRTTFALPDARGRALIHQGSGPGLPLYRIGQRGGSPTSTLTTLNLPSHNHVATVHAVGAAGNSGTPASNVVPAAVSRGTLYSSAAPDVTMSPGMVTTGNTGGSQSFSTVSPYLTVNCQIALVGIFPSRN